MPLANIMLESAGKGLFERTIESFQMVFGSWKLVGIVMACSLSVPGLSMTGIIVTALSTAVHRDIYEALRSIAVWVLSIVVDYAFPDSGAGGHLNCWFFLEAFGFIVSISGRSCEGRKPQCHKSATAFIFDETTHSKLTRILSLFSPEAQRQ
jgi:hypothetical protein